MRKFLQVLFLGIAVIGYCQNFDFSSGLKVIYTSKMKLGENYTKTQDFVLVGDSRSSFFTGFNSYQEEFDKSNVISKSNGVTLAKGDYFQEKVINNDTNFFVFNKLIDSRIRYQEKVKLTWVLYGDKKVINGVNCQMAATNKFGRRWIAWFSLEHQLPIGPYKFYGLPGLIFELYDTRDDYHFTLVSLEKNKDVVKLNLGNYKNYTKEQYLKVTTNLLYTPVGMPEMNAAMQKEFDDLVEWRKRRYSNPIETMPFE